VLTDEFVAAAAARINAQLQARKGIQHVDVPPIQKPDNQSPTPPVSATASAPPSSAGAHRKIDGEMYVSDGDYIKDIEVNDLRNRYTLTKGATQKMVNIALKTCSLMLQFGPPAGICRN